MRYKLFSIFLFLSMIGIDTFAVDQKPLVINPTTGKQEQIQASATLVNGAGVPYSTGASSVAYTYNVKDSPFSAVGNGASHPLSVGDAAAYNTAFAAYGFTGANAVNAGDEKDWAAIQAAWYKAANTGAQVYIPSGTYYCNRTLTLTWTATPITGQPQTPLLSNIFGDGVASIIYATAGAAGEGAVQLLGESNGHAVNCKMSNLTVQQDPACHKYSFCLRLGDGYVGINLDRVICKGAQALALKVASSVSYAQLSFKASQCQFWSNWNHGWGADAGLDVYSVVPESGGSYWDNVLFESCLFWGQVDCRSFDLKFLQCIFATPPDRALPYNSTVYLGCAEYDSCYFEDALISIATLSNLAPITTISIHGCHFSSNNNLTPPATVQSSVQCGRGTYEHGPLSIYDCRFGGTASYFDIDLYGPMTASVTHCCRPFGTINIAPTINTNGNVKIEKWNPNGEVGNDVHSFTAVTVDARDFVAPATFTQDTTGQALLTASNPNVAADGNVALEALSGTVSGKFIAFHAAHSSLAKYVGILNSEATGTIAMGLGGPLYWKLSDIGTNVEGPGRDGEFGEVIKNASTGANAYAALRVNQDQGKGLAIVSFGSGYGFGLAGQSWVGTSAADKLVFSTNGGPRMSIDGSSGLASILYGVTANRTSSVGNELYGNTAGSAITTGTYNTIVGYASGTTLQSGYANILIGAYSGSELGTSDANNFVAGSVTAPIQRVYFGNGVANSTPSSFVINGTGATGTDINGADIILAGGASTGSGIGGSVIFQITLPGATGATPNSPTSAVVIDTNGSVHLLMDTLSTVAANGTLVIGSTGGQQVGIGQGVIFADVVITSTGGFYTQDPNFMMRISGGVPWTNGANAGVGTLTNAPNSGDPAKWIPIDDNGTTRYVPAWTP